MRKLSRLSGRMALPLALVCTVAAVVYFVVPGGEPGPAQVADSQPALTPAQPAKQTPATAVTPELPGVKKKAEGFDFDDAMKEKLRTISDAYQAQSQYPDFSRPINADELESKYRSDIPVPNDQPAKLDDPGSPTLSILTNQFRYYAGDPLVASARISGLSDQETSMVTARLKRGGEVIGQATVSAAPDDAHSYYLDFNALQLSDVGWKETLTIEAQFAFRGESYSRSTTIEYVSTVADVEGVAPAEVRGEYLRIPVYVSTDKPGRHRLKANLYDAKTGDPLVHLRAEDDLSASNGSLVLKAHIAALKQAGSEGPYELGDVMLTRLPTAPDYITEYGRVDQKRFSVEGHSFDEYTDKPYVNPKAQRIARELQRLGS
ncbi:hypothetical protein QQM79_05390 [Marinobacteraceae bacterium S3BR75-40.1]